MNRLAVAPLTTFVLALGLVACGGGGSSDAPTKAEFAADADKVCATAEKNLGEIGQNATSPAEIAKAVDKVIAETQKSLDDLKALDRPEGSAGDAADEFVNSLSSDIEDKGIPALEKLRDALKNNDQKAAQQAAQELQAIDSGNTDKLARAAGANGCAN
jgi:ElaB/YqjD/DUF883 family membrane-anchored ribosome-binding protein